MFCMTASADAALPEETPLAGVDKKMPMLELLPVGSTLTKVSVTEYAGPRLSLLMTASSMTVVAPHEAAGKTLNIYLYGKNSQVTHLFSGDASYFLDRKLVVSRTETTIREENFSARGARALSGYGNQAGYPAGPRQDHYSRKKSQQVTATLP